jgi:geranylgeranyl diphosphate synthase type II
MSAVAAPLAEYLESRRVKVDAALEACLPSAPDCPESLAAAMHYAVFPGGKRLRPMLVLLAAEACGGAETAAMPAACAVELVHCYSLVHDDLPAMDDDDLRRGRPTCHKRFGEAMAILAGDGLLTLAFEMLSRQSASPELAAASCSVLALAAGAAGMVGGQVDDMAAVANWNGDRASAEALKSIHARKTGALLRACVRLGGLAAGACPESMRALDGYGQQIGLAFQIADDLLDACGAESATGKRVGKDDGQGKLTFPGLVGVVESRQMARDLCRDACEQLGPLGSRADRLKELAQFIVERDR